MFRHLINQFRKQSKPNIQRDFHLFTVLSNKNIDFSRVPVLNEKELEEQFVRGSGPGICNQNNHYAIDKRLIKLILFQVDKR